MPMRLTFIACCCVIALACGGCGTKTNDARIRAGELQNRIKEYRSAQAQRLARLNSEYAAAFTRLMDQFEQATTQELDQSREGDAQRIADRLIAHFGDASLRGDFRAAFASAVAEQRSRIRKADEAIAATRLAYETSYREASLDLSKLDKIQEYLAELSAKEEDRRIAANFIQRVLKAYEALREEARQETAGATDGATGSATGGG
jgi:hypothetical protein